MTGKTYSILNQLMLGKGGEWATFKQWTSLGGKIRSGSHARKVVYWDFLVTDKQTGKSHHTTEEDRKNNPQDIWGYLKYSNVFHISDVEGVEPLGVQSARILPKPEAERVAQEYLKKYNIKFEENTDSEDAYYSPVLDTVVLPNFSRFKYKGGYYSTLFHELTHSTGHPSRLNRLKSGEKTAFGGEEYGKEELVAEIGSAYIVKLLGMNIKRTEKQNIAYCQNWYNAIKGDKKLFCHAASQAEKAANMILDCCHDDNGGSDGGNRDSSPDNGGTIPPRKFPRKVR